VKLRFHVPPGSFRVALAGDQGAGVESAGRLGAGESAGRLGAGESAGRLGAGESAGRLGAGESAGRLGGGGLGAV
jgi:hypothetical protein